MNKKSKILIMCAAYFLLCSVGTVSAATWFTDSGQNLGNSMTRSVFLGDIDKDGDLDFIAGNSHYQSNKIYINNGVGIFSDSGQNLGSSIGTYGVALGDVDNDGDLDLVSQQLNFGIFL